MTASVLDDFADHLRHERGRSEHTIRAYLSDVRGLIAFAGARGVRVGDIDLALLRSWLAEHTRRGAARTTVAHQVSSAKTFCAWAFREQILGDDPSTRLQAPKAHRTLPPILAPDEAVAAIAAAGRPSPVSDGDADGGDVGGGERAEADRGLDQPVPRATLGGAIGNDACGNRALGYGKTSDNLLGLELVTAGGEVLRDLFSREGDGWFDRQTPGAISSRFHQTVRRKA